MAKKEKGTGFFAEFKKFITRGNVLDMAVGVIVGGAFTGIVNGLSNFILKPIINWILALVLPGEGLAAAITPLGEKIYTVDANGNQILDLTKTIYIDWGSFISAIINFFLIAFVLFLIVRTINRVAAAKTEAANSAAIERNAKKEIKKIRKAEKVSKVEAQAIYVRRIEEAKAAAAAAEEEAKKKAEEEARLAEEKANAPIKLLAEIRDLLQSKE